MKVQNVYTSVGCNRTPECADWNDDGLIVFGACNSIALLSHSESKIIRTFTEHKAQVNTVKWINRKIGCYEFISGSDDAAAIIWDISDQDNPKKAVLKGHNEGITVIDSTEEGNKLTVATASNDSTIRIWQETDKDYYCVQTIDLISGFCFSIRFAYFSQLNRSLLAFSDDTSKINLLYANTTGGKFEYTLADRLAGHEDWIRGLDFSPTDTGDLLLASSSQDSSIRLWRISVEFIDHSKANAITNEIQVEKKRIPLLTENGNETAYLAVNLESILHGHEGWVYGVDWGNSHEGLQLLSSSIDKTLIVWMLSEDGVWMERHRLGEVGGNSLGFYGGKFSDNCNAIMAHGYQGSFHIWRKFHNGENSWEPQTISSGHYADVHDIAWDPKGAFCMSISADQTTRLHAPCKIEGKDTSWHEIARPQVHGYDLQCIAVLSRYRFASGAEEKVIRAFQAPNNFVQNFRRLCQISNDPEGDIILKNSPVGASVPSLGLSNKAVYEGGDKPNEANIKDEYPDSYFTSVTLTSPPNEEVLIQNTLWPEIQKLYGHGFEIFSLAATSDGQLLASACRATAVQYAQIIIWDTCTWKPIQKLTSHQLTVTQMKFSHDNIYLLSVSRDRRWSLFENKRSTNFELVASIDKTNKIHSRIIWSCDWSHDSKYFLTSSRDGKLVVWGQNYENNSYKWIDLNFLEFKNESVTACAFGFEHYNNDESYLIAAGFENGIIKIFSFDNKWEHLLTLNTSYAHHLAVKKIVFRPLKNIIQFASCGEDHLVRIYEI